MAESVSKADVVILTSKGRPQGVTPAPLLCPVQELDPSGVETYTTLPTPHRIGSTRTSVRVGRRAALV
jgi:hypothetical protein